MSIRPFQAGDESAVVALWQRCGLVRPWNDPLLDIQRKRDAQPELFGVLCVEGSGEIIGTVMAGYEGHRGSKLGSFLSEGTKCVFAGPASCPTT